MHNNKERAVFVEYLASMDRLAEDAWEPEERGLKAGLTGCCNQIKQCSFRQFQTVQLNYDFLMYVPPFAKIKS